MPKQKNSLLKQIVFVLAFLIAFGVASTVAKTVVKFIINPSSFTNSTNSINISEPIVTQIPIPTDGAPDENIGSVQTKEDCENNNGIWMKGPFGEGPFCNKTFSDGGKTCKDSSECLSQQCISSDHRNNSSSIVGKCSDKTTVYGCHGLVKKGKLTNFSCID